MNIRRVGAITYDGQFTVIEEAVPELKKGQVLVEVKASLVSPGTELMHVLQLRKTPNIDKNIKRFGYSSAGVVIKQGPGCEDIPLGSRVACMGGGYALHSDFNCVPRNLIAPIPEGMSFEHAAFAHLGATALHALRRAELQIGENLLVVGLGLIGQIAVQIAATSNVHVLALDRLPVRLALAKKGGAGLALNPSDYKEAELLSKVKEYTKGYGMDTALIAFGGNATEVMKLIVKMMKLSPDTHPMGTIVNVGCANFQTENWPVGFGNIDIRASSRPGAGYHDEAYEHGQEYPPVFVQWTTKRNMEEVLRMASRGNIDLNSLITHRLPIAELPKGMETLLNAPNEALGVILNY